MPSSLERDDVLDDVAGDVDRVGAEAADDAVGDAEGGRQDEELVVAFEPVDLDDLDLGVAHVEAGAEDALVGDHEVVGELGAQHDQLVDAGAAVDRDRRVDVVLDLVVAAAGADVERACRSRSRAPMIGVATSLASSGMTSSSQPSSVMSASALLQTPSPLLSMRTFWL